jgi:TatD DNase family protein
MTSEQHDQCTKADPLCQGSPNKSVPHTYIAAEICSLAAFSPMLIDTHAHLYLDRFDDDRAAVIQRARDAGVQTIVMPAIDVPSIQQAVDLCEQYDGLYAMAALHPSETDEATEADFEAVAEWCDNEHIVAVGESGLDYYWDRSFDDRQQDFFRKHIRLAIETDLPLIIHNREATGDILQILREEKEASDRPERLRGILHCFVDPPEVAEEAKELGFIVGVGGIMTFSNSEVDSYVRDIPMEQIVVETDAPYLAPEPNRGKRNEPAYVRHVAEKLARLKDLPIAEVERITTENARRIYGLG